MDKDKDIKTSIINEVKKFVEAPKTNLEIINENKWIDENKAHLDTGRRRQHEELMKWCVKTKKKEQKKDGFGE